MYKLCKTEQSAARQHELEAGLLAAMGTKRYEEISVSDLCDQLGIPRKSFYRYFSGKDGALHALLDHTIMGYESFPGEQPAGEPRTLLRDLERFFQFWIHHKPLLDALERSKLSGLLIERCILHAVEGTTIPRRFLPFDTREMREHVAMFGVCGLMSMILQWHHGGYHQPPRHMAKLAVRLLTQPLFPTAQQLI